MRGTRQAAAPTLAADNPWDIRNFARYLNGDQVSQNGWLQLQCPHHAGEGSSGSSLGINEATGQFTCHSGCDNKDVYRAAWQLAEERGWVPPKPKVEKKIEQAVGKKAATPTVEPENAATLSSGAKPILEDAPSHLKQWRRYAEGVTGSSEKARDFQIIRRALADGVSKKAAIELLAKNSQHAKALFKREGSTPAFHYVSSVVSAAMRQNKQRKTHSKGIER